MRSAPEDQPSGPLAWTLATLASLGARRPVWVLCGAVLTCAVSLWYTSSNLRFHTHRNDLLSPQKDYFKRWQQYLTEFGDDDDMVVVVKGTNRGMMIDALEGLAHEVRNRPEHFDRLFYKVDLKALGSRALLFLNVAQIRGIQQNLKGMSLLLDPPVLGGLDPHFGWKSLTLVQLLHEGERRAGALQGGRAPQAEEIDYLKQLEMICRSASQLVQDPANYANPWHSILPATPPEAKLLDEPQYFLSQDGSLAFLLVRPLKDTAQFTYARLSIDALRSLLERLRDRFPDLEFGLTGLPVLENDEMIASQDDAQRASLLALAGVALLYFLVYRGLRYPLLTVGTLLVGMVWSLGWLTLTVGHLNILSAAFAVMLIGMGDYGVLWVTRFAQERQTRADFLQAIRATAVQVGPSILTAALTTALAFFATMLADLKAVAELGWIAGSGILLCALACFVVLPALLAVWEGWLVPLTALSTEGRTDRAVLPLEAYRVFSRQWLPWVTRQPRTVVLSSLGVCLVLGGFALWVKYDHNLLQLQSPVLESVRWEKILVEKTTGASWHALSYTTTPEEALALKARYEQLPEVSRVVEVASLVPAEQDRKLEIMQDIQYRLRRLPPRGQTVAHAPPSLDDLRRTATRLSNILAALDAANSPGTVAEFARIREGSPRESPNSGEFGYENQAWLPALRGTLQSFISTLDKTPPALTGQRLQAFQSRLTTDLAEDLHRLRDVSTPEPIGVADLPACLRERYLGASGKWKLCIFARACLWDYDPLKRFVHQVRTIDPDAFGKPFSTLEGLRAMRNGFLWASVYALAAMVLVLFWDFGSLKHLALALLPLAMGLAAALGVMSLFGVPLNPANMIAFPLILGVGADNGVHVLHDFRARTGRRYSLSFATGKGIMVASLTTILGFGTLMIAQHRGMASLGFILSLGVSACMLTALVFLPALLRIMSTRQGKQDLTDRHDRMAA